MRYGVITLCISFFAGVINTAFPQQHIFRNYTVNDGLISNSIRRIFQDSKGFLWIATEAGIVRYNGMSFKTYTSDDDQHITNERVLFLVRNNAGAIYTADNTGNIFTINKNLIR